MDKKIYKIMIAYSDDSEVCIYMSDIKKMIEVGEAVKT